MTLKQISSKYLINLDEGCLWQYSDGVITDERCGRAKAISRPPSRETVQGEVNLGAQESSLLACSPVAAGRIFVRREIFIANWTL